MENNSVISIAGYKWYGNNRRSRNVRAPKGSGGVGILVKNDMFIEFNISVIDKSVDGILCISLVNRHTHRSFVICVCYLPPITSIWGRNSDHFFTHMTNTLYSCSDFDHIVICGDFNARIGNLRDSIVEIDCIPHRNVIDLVKSGHCVSLIEFIKDAQLCILNGRITPDNDDFTCVSTRGKSVVDYFLTTHDNINNCTRCEVDLISDMIVKYNCVQMLCDRCKAPDHSMLTMVVTYIHKYDPIATLVKGERQKIIMDTDKRYDFHNVPQEFMNNEDWGFTIIRTTDQINNCVGAQEEVDTLYDNLVKDIFAEMDIYLECKNRRLPKRKFKHSKPYWNNNLTMLWRNMRNAEKLFVKCHGSNNIKTTFRNAFKIARNVFDKELRKAERRYRKLTIDNIEITCTVNPKQFWKKLKSLGPRKTHEIPLQIKQGETFITETNAVLDHWTNEFTQLYNPNSLDNLFDDAFYREICVIAQGKEQEMNNYMYEENAAINGEITFNELYTTSGKLKNSKACGIDGIPNEILKNPNITPILIALMNMCFYKNVLPSLWAKSIIRPIPKSSANDPYTPLNYRGISLLSCTSKLLSSILNRRISNYCDTLDLVVDEQNGFRRNRSCEEHIFTLTSIIRKRKHEGLSKFVAFIDLEKCFDWVDRKLLLYTLLCYNIDGKVYKIIEQMYSKTSSCLILNDLLTDWFDVNSGVRQGDNLSPTLFNLFINDLALHIKRLAKGITVGNDTISILMYADDMILCANNEIDLQCMITAMCDWTKLWRVKVNINKSKIVHFRPVRRQRTIFEFCYGLDAMEIVDSYKYLGVFLDEHLNYNKCSQILAESARRALGGVINKIKTIRDCGYTTYTKLFDTGVVSILNYGAEVWGYGQHAKCDVVVNKAMRYFLGVHKFAPAAALHGDMGWISLKYRRYQVMLKFWNRLVKMDNSRLTKRVFLWCYRYPVNNWCGEIRNLAVALDMINVYDSVSLFNLDEVKIKYRSMMSNEWITEIQSKPKLRTYRHFKDNFEVEPYVKYHVPKASRSIFAQFRMGILPLCIETGRFKRILVNDTGMYRNLNVNERTCNVCNLNMVEDEKHFLFYCNTYAFERQQFFENCHVDHINIDTNYLLYLLMKHEWKSTLRFINTIWDKRKSIEYNVL